MLMAPSEKNVWKKLPLKSHVNQVNDNKNDYKLAFGGKKIIRMVGSEKLPVLARLLDNPNYIDINNFYQRRLSWDKQAQSRLIESFLYNFPVPSITLYQRGHNSYIVVDGKQRMIAIRDFYDNKLQLTGLELNPELNGLTYNQIPEKFKENINRRVIDTVALLTDNTFNPEEVSQQKALTELMTYQVIQKQESVGQAIEIGTITEWFKTPKAAIVNMQEITSLSVGGSLFLVSEAYCQLAKIESIQVNDESVSVVQTTSEMEVGLKFDVDAKRGLRVYQCF